MTPAHASPTSDSEGLAPRLRARSTPVPSIKEGILDNDAIGAVPWLDGNLHLR